MIERKTAERIAREFHETYESLAPLNLPGHERPHKIPWNDVPKNNKELMIAVVWELFDRGVIVKGEARI